MGLVMDIVLLILLFYVFWIFCGGKIDPCQIIRSCFRKYAEPFTFLARRMFLLRCVWEEKKLVSGVVRNFWKINVNGIIYCMADVINNSFTKHLGGSFFTWTPYLN